MKEKVYYCIDLKSFFASVECVERGLDPFETNLVVADPEREEGTICLAITPKMKKLGVKNRCRVFEIPKGIDYIMAKPRMKLYMNKSAEIIGIYLNYISDDDMHVYSIDECFIDATDYLTLYGYDKFQFAKILMKAVFDKTGIQSTCGIGTNLFLAKLALDITAKKSTDFIGYLDIDIFKKEIWFHRPLSDIWNIGPGISQRLSKFGIYDLHGITQFDPKILYKEFGINAELIIDHANGIEPCEIKDIKAYKSKFYSLSNGQVLFKDYSYVDAQLILKEMVNQIVLQLVNKKLVTNNISLSVGYSKDIISPTGGSKNIDKYTQSLKLIMRDFVSIFKQTTNRLYPIRRINVGLNNLKEELFMTYDLFTDVKELNKEKDLLLTVINIKEKYGKNSILKGIDFEDCATQIERNKMIGGHNDGENDKC